MVVRQSENPAFTRIVKAACFNFYCNGYHNTSIQDIANCANLKRGNVIYYMEKKEQILIESVKFLDDHIRNVLSKMVTRANTSEQVNLYNFIQDFINLLFKGEYKYCIPRVTAELKHKYLDLKGIARVHFNGIEALIECVIRSRFGFSEGRKKTRALINEIIRYSVLEEESDRDANTSWIINEISWLK